MEKVKIGGIYRHYKNKDYRVLALATHSETLEEMVVYQALYGEEKIWVRPLLMFTESIEKNQQIIKRFQLIENE